MRLRTILLVLASLAFLSAALGGYLQVSSLRQSALSEARRQTALNAKAVHYDVSSFLSEYQRAARTLAGLNDVQQALLRGDRDSRSRADAVLDQFKDALAVSVCYVMNRDGLTILSSNRDAPDSFVGKNYAFRPYFQEAIQGKPNIYLALGVTSGVRGIYYSHPIQGGKAKAPIGVAVVKAAIEPLETDFPHGKEGITLLADPHGLIFASSRKEWLYRTLWKTSAETISKVAASRQFGEGPWTWTGLEMTGENLAADRSGNEFLVYRLELDQIPGWHLVQLTDLHALSHRVLTPIFRTSVPIVLGLCVLIGLSVFILYSRASRDIARQMETEDALRASEEKLRAITGSALDAIILMDSQGRISYWNPAAERIFGYTATEVLGKDLHLFLAPEEYHGAYRRGFPEFQHTGTGPVVGKTFEFLARRKDGNTFPIEISTSAINIKHEWHAAGIIRDITGRKQAEASLRESEEKYRTILESMEEGYFEVDLAGNFTFSNDAVCTMSGYSRDELKGMNNRSYTSPETAKKMFRVFNGIYRTGKPATMMDYEMIRKDGTKRILELSASLMRDSAGKPVGFRGVIRDVTDRKRAEEALRESEEKYRTVLEANPDPVVVYDGDWRVVYFNPAFTRLFGWTLNECLGKKMDEFVPGENHGEMNAMMARLVAGESLSGVESRRCSKNGQVLPVSVSGAIYRDRDGNPLGSIINLRDISEQRKLQGQLQHAQKMEAVGTLAGGIAHDFNNLLQAVQGYAELLLRGKAADNPESAGLRNIINAAKRGGELTRQLLTFSRKVESKKRPVDLNCEVHDVRRLLERTLPRMIGIELCLAHDLNIVNADPVHIGQVLMNLAVNSKDAMPQGGRLLIVTENVTLDAEFCKTNLGAKPGNYVMLGVSDTGHGMDSKTIAHIFEPFYTTKGPGKGTGLGLAMVYGIVKDHDGYITCHSAPGVGTSFTVYLPAIEEPLATKVDWPTLAPITKGSETILIVDDEESIRDVTVNLLGVYGYTVLAAADGEIALEVFCREQGRIDLVILDLIMPGMGGLKCLREILKIDRNALVLVASGYAAGGPSREAVEAGAKGYIGKPYDIEKMAATIREVLDRNRNLPSSQPSSL
jgi:PAS domain S-box-containing protein